MHRTANQPRNIGRSILFPVYLLRGNARYQSGCWLHTGSINCQGRPSSLLALHKSSLAAFPFILGKGKEKVPFRDAGVASRWTFLYLLHGRQRLFPVSVLLIFSSFTFLVQESTKHPLRPLSVCIWSICISKGISSSFSAKHLRNKETQARL